MAEKVLNIAAWDTGQRRLSAGIRTNQPGSTVGMPVRLAWQTLGAKKSCSNRWENDLRQQKQKPQSLSCGKCVCGRKSAGFGRTGRGREEQ